MRQARFSLRKRDFDDLINRLRKHNRYLEKFTNRCIEFEPSRRKRKQSAKLRELGEYAKSVFHALDTSFGCDCRGSDSHTALFGLASRSPEITPESDKTRGKIEFQVVVSGIHPSTVAPDEEVVIWREMSLEPTKEESESNTQRQTLKCSTEPQGGPSAATSPGPPTSKSVRFFQALHTRTSASTQSRSGAAIQRDILTNSRIGSQTSTAVLLTPPTASTSQPPPSHMYVPSMCKIICTSPASTDSSCLGYIADGDCKFLLYPLSRSSALDEKCWSTISLRQILQNTAVCAPPLTPWDRLTLAATVAFAVLQLHDTPWLKPAWDHDDVLFLQREGGRLYKQVFIAKTVPNRGKAAIKPSQTSIFNETQLALAIVLVKLRLGPLELLQTAEDLRAGICANMVTLWRLVENDEIGIIFGPKYQSAVKLCIELAKVSSSFNEQVQQDLYNGVASVLEDQAMRRNSAF